MANSISADLDALAAFHQANAAALGIKKADRHFNGLINDAELPLVVVRVGPAPWMMQTFTMRRYTRKYMIEVFVKPVVEGRHFQEAYEACFPILQAFGDLYLANLTLNSGVLQIWPEGGLVDSGVVELAWGGKAFFGFRYELPIIGKYI